MKHHITEGWLLCNSCFSDTCYLWHTSQFAEIVKMTVRIEFNCLMIQG